jgi:hypothetical protein
MLVADSTVDLQIGGPHRETESEQFILFEVRIIKVYTVISSRYRLEDHTVTQDQPLGNCSRMLPQ